jgi:hypothetical protein
MSAASELHNLLAGRFVRDVAGPAIKNGATYAEMMTLFESCQLGMLELLNVHFEMTPAVAVGLLEASQHAAIERFAEKRKGTR